MYLLLVWLLIFVSHRCKSTTMCAEFTTVQQSLITRTMYWFSNNTTDHMQENDLIVNQDWRCLLLNVMHWNIYGKILVNKRRKKETLQKPLTMFSSYLISFSNRVCFNRRLNLLQYLLKYRNKTNNFIVIVYLTRDDDECRIRILHESKLNVLLKTWAMKQCQSLAVGVICALVSFFTYKNIKI